MSRVFVVTGSNKGIGKAIVEALAQKVHDAVIYLTARNPELGQAALNDVRSKLGAAAPGKVLFHQLNITDDESAAKAAADLKAAHGGIDVLVNNAGFAFHNDATEPPEVQAEVTIGVNYYGTKLVSEHFLPLIRDGGRVVNVCSMMGVMTGAYSPENIARLRDAQTLAGVDAFVEDYKRNCNPDTRRQAGFPESAYRVSKAAEIALTVLLSREVAARNIKVYACCPGYVATDMTRHGGHLTVEQGADTPVFLATEADFPTGVFVRERQVAAWY